MPEPQAYPFCLDNPRHVHVFSCPEPGPMDSWRARLHCESASHVPDEHCACSMRHHAAEVVDSELPPTS